LKVVRMQEAATSLFEMLEQFYKEMKRRRTRTVSDATFKNTSKEIFTSWKTQIKPQIESQKLLDKAKIRNLDCHINLLFNLSTERVADTKQVISVLSETNATLFRYLLITKRASAKTFAVPESRESLLKGLSVQLEHFEIAFDYFEEAKSCFKYGLLRASTIMAISALETCLKTDYLRIKGEEFDGKLFDLINIYFSGRMKRLPKQYEDFSKTYVKIRNSFTHPEEFDYSENLVFAVLSTVAELMKAVEKHYAS
jgi:hypothetical protein